VIKKNLKIIFFVLGGFVGDNRQKIAELKVPCTCGGTVLVEPIATCVTGREDPDFEIDERGSSIMVSEYIRDIEEQSM
jgi:hypothetical protein